MHKWQISCDFHAVPYCRLECWTEESDVQHSGVHSIRKQRHCSPLEKRQRTYSTNSPQRPVALITH
jgi:hypothetical protein